MASSRSSPYSTVPSTRYRQGDILRTVTIIEWAEIHNGELILTERNFPYCVVISQECDLEHDFNNHADEDKLARGDRDKCLQSLLLCPAYPAEQLKLGAHLEAISLKMQRISSDEWRRIKQNNIYRYHYLPEYEAGQIPDLVLDFKHYITVPRNIAYRGDFKGSVLISLDDLFREHLSSRFAHYLSRIGLPELESPQGS